MKKTSLILAILLVVAFSVFAVASVDDEGGTVDQGSGTANTSQTSTEASKGEAEKNESKEDDANLGKYSVVIDSCRLSKTYDGKDAVIVKYIFTNVSNDTATAFMWAFDDTVYQNGIGLNEAYVLVDSAKYSSDNQTKEIKKGASLEVEVAYELNDSTTDIEVEVKESFSFDDKTVKKTFSIK